MGLQETFDHVLTSLYQSVFDDTLWPATSALIDEVCGITGNGLIVGEDYGDNVRLFFARFYYRGQRREDREREYFTIYHPADERMPRLRQLPDSQLAHVKDLYTDQELRTSPAYNEWLPRAGAQNGLNVRLDGPGGSRIVWATADPMRAEGWGSRQVGMIERLLPHIGQFVQLRQALAGADALNASLAQLLDNTRVGVIHLDWRGRIVEANDHARDILRQGSGLFDRGGSLSAWLPEDNANLARLLRRALPDIGGQAPAGGSMVVQRSPGLPHLTLHITPLFTPQTDFGPKPVSALMLVISRGGPTRVDAPLVAASLRLTPAQSEVAALLAEGLSVRDIAVATGRHTNVVYKHLKQTYRKLGISRQADLVRIVLSRVQL